MRRADLERAPEMPPSIMPVAILSGSDYEMGYQYGQQMAPYMKMRLDELWARVLRQFSYDDLLHELAEAQRYIKQDAPETIDMMQGIANGATDAGYKISYIDVLLRNVQARRAIPDEEQLASSEPWLPHEEAVASAGCTGFSAWGRATKDGKLICCDSADNVYGANVATVAFPDKGNSYIAMTAWVGHLLVHPGFNNKGLVYTHHAGGADGGRPTAGEGLPYSIALLHTLRFANNSKEAEKMILGFDTSAGGQWVDIHGNNCAIERNSPRAVRRAGDFGETDFIYSTNNALMKEPEQEEYVEHGGWYQTGRWGRCAIGRNLTMWNMLHNYHGAVDMEFVKMMWRFAGDPPPSYDPETYIVTHSQGWEHKICHLMNEYVTIMLPDDGDRGKMYICSGPVGRVAYPVDPAGYSFRIAPTNTFYELSLASNPSAVVSNAKVTANACLLEAYNKLMWLKPTDAGYSGLNELFSVAKAEYWQGHITYNEGLLTGGNERLLCFSKAVTAFARSQAHAKQVFEALVPPPTTPSDLKGLEDKPWFGEWGEWATRESREARTRA